MRDASFGVKLTKLISPAGASVAVRCCDDGGDDDEDDDEEDFVVDDDARIDEVLVFRRDAACRDDAYGLALRGFVAASAAAAAAITAVLGFDVDGGREGGVGGIECGGCGVYCG